MERISGSRAKGGRKKRVEKEGERVQVELKETKGAMVEMCRRNGLGGKEEWAEMRRGGRVRRVMEWAGGRGEIENEGIREEKRQRKEMNRKEGLKRKCKLRGKEGEVSDVREWWKRGGVEKKKWKRERGIESVIERGGGARKTGREDGEVDEKWERIRIKSVTNSWEAEKASK